MDERPDEELFTSLLGSSRSTLDESDDYEEGKVVRLECYKSILWRKVLFIILCIGTGGLFALFTKWFQLLSLNIVCTKTGISSADRVLITRKDKSYDIVPIQFVQNIETGEKYRMIIYRCQRYFYDMSLGQFYQPTFDTNVSFSDMHKGFGKGNTRETHRSNSIYYGPNIIQVPVKSYLFLLLNEVLHPFYIFQVCSMIIWALDDYYVYAIAIFVTSAFAAVTNVVQLRGNMVKLQSMASYVTDVNFINSEGDQTISSEDLVPGDLIEIIDGLTLPCDAIVLSGVAILNESMLTGESIPVIKTPLPENDEKSIYNVDNDNKHTLFSGTIVVQARPAKIGGKVVALVTKTAYQTAKGQLVRSILFPKPTKLEFYRDSFRFVGVMFALAMIGFLYSVYQFIQLKASPLEIALRGLDIFTIVVPPALPLALTAGQYMAIKRMQIQKIYCISPPRVNEAGKIEMMCFDKTGTLTEDGLDVLGVHPSDKSGFWEKLSEKVEGIPITLENCLKTCHAISEVHGSYIGDPLDIKMFQYTNYHMEEPINSQYLAVVKPPNGNDSQSFGILKRYQFSSALQRMSVIVRNHSNDKIESYMKGSPEKLKTLCRPETIPSDYDKILGYYANNGYRVIACASYEFDSNFSESEIGPLQREQAENNFTFNGFLVMSNQLKFDTADSIGVLNGANIRNIMITGDNVLTAVNVAKQCYLMNPDKPVFISTVHKDTHHVVWTDVLNPTNVLNSDIADLRQFQLAVTGEAFDLIPEELLMKSIIPTAQVYARMTPKQKTKLIENLLTLNKIVGMCGDGANDCGALKTANVGLSLSEAEASVAAPFTSKNPSISSVITLLREGRCALVTSFSLFKYMAIYSMIQFGSVLILYGVGCVLGDLQFLYCDMALILPLCWAIGLTGPYQKLTEHRPTTKLISKPVLVSIIGQIIIQIAFLVTIFQILQHQSWYTPFVREANFEKGPQTTLTQETTTIFLYSNFQYISMIIAYSISYPFRLPIYKNSTLTITLAIQLICCILLTLFVDFSLVAKVLQLVHIPISFRFVILAVAAGNFVVNWVYERIFVVWFCAHK